MRLVLIVGLLHTFAALPSSSQTWGSTSPRLPKLEPLATFRDRWNANDCHTQLSTHSTSWTTCCVPLVFDVDVADDCRTVSIDTAKLSDEDENSASDASAGTENTAQIADTQPTHASSSWHQDPSTSTGDLTASSVAPQSSMETDLTTVDNSSIATSAISTFLSAGPTAAPGEEAAPDDGYRAEGGSVTSTTAAATLTANQADTSQTTAPDAYIPPAEPQTGLQPEDTSSPYNPVSAISPEIYRHRAQSAVNLGFWFVAEQYGTPEYFKGCATSDSAEFNIAEGCTKEYMEDFWRSFITEKDFAAMAEMGINTVRLPIGYWSVGKENCRCDNTPFWPFIDKYASQWGYILQAIAWASKYNIGVLVDFHAAEGSQNGWDHSGIHSKQPLFLTDPAHLAHSTEVLVWVAQQIKDMPNIVGLQLLNEPYPDTPEIIDPWYESTMAALTPILDNDFPFYVFGNNANRAAWVKRQANFVVMDFHLYFLWNARIGEMSVEELISRMSTYYGPLLDSFGPNLIIGEWACTLSNPSTSWQDYTKFCDAQVALLNRASVAGWHYWSWKTEGNYNSTWSFLSSTGGSEGLRRAQTDQRELLIPPSHQSDFSIDIARSSGPAKNKIARKRALIDLEDPGALVIWEQGCETAQEFAKSGSRLGFSERWVSRRRLDFAHSEQEYYQHFSRGLQDCEM